MLIFISKRNVEPPELRLVGDLREYNLRKLGLITLSLLPTIKATVIRILMSLKTEIEPCMVYPMYSFQADVFFPTEISKINSNRF